jgi:antitoxin VapB
MVLSIKNAEADQLARELAAVTGESLTEAVITALRERVERERARRGPGKAARLARLAEEYRDLPVRDARPAEEIIGYDGNGLPR